MKNVNATRVRTFDDVNRELENIRHLLRHLPLFVGQGSPENNVPAPLGSFYMNLNGGYGTSAYIKESNHNDNSGWFALNVNPESLSMIAFNVNSYANILDINVSKLARVALPDKDNPGSYIDMPISAPSPIYGDGHASENFNLGETGQTLAVAWGNNYPITWYLTIKSGVVYWVCSRNPCMTQMPASGNNIGDFDAAPVTSNQSNVFVAASITEADFVDLPVWPIGTMPITRAAASSIPTLVALTAGVDGPGLWNENTVWTFPAGQNGNRASYYWYSDGSNEPTYATPANILATYRQTRTLVSYHLNTKEAGNCTQGAGADATGVCFYLPLAQNVSGFSSTVCGVPYGSAVINAVLSLLLLRPDSDVPAGVESYFINASTQGQVYENTWGDNAADDVEFIYSYNAF